MCLGQHNFVVLITILSHRVTDVTLSQEGE